MAHVYGVSAIQVRHPVLHFVLVEADDAPLQLIVPWR